MLLTRGFPRAKGLLLLAFLLTLLPAAAYSGQLLEDFEQGLSSAWEKKIFKGETFYRVVADGQGHCLKAECENSASGLVLKKEYDLKEFQVLSWRWKVDGVLEKGDGRSKAGDDFPARIYVIFPHWLPWKTRSINYIWANRLPEGTVIPNSHTGNAVMFALQSGAGNAERWVTERRNVYEDFRQAFGEEPPKVGAIAIMTDADNTGGRATAWYDDLGLEQN